MEFTLDTALIDRIAADEIKQTAVDLTQLGPVGTLGRSQERHDARLAAAGDANTLACKNGCYWCCYFTVEVRPVEVVRIVEFMQREMLEADRLRIEGEIRTNSAALAVFDEETRMRHNMKCPFLRFGRCSIYPVRPQTCRNYHATNATGCEQAYREPDNDDIDPEFAPLVYQSGGAHVEAFSIAMREAGYDAAVYELNAAMTIALDDPSGVRMRFEAKQPPFRDLEGADVEPEFVDVDR